MPVRIVAAFRVLSLAAMAANASSSYASELENEAHPIFFVTDTPFFPEGTKRCRRLIETYESILETTMQFLETQQRKCLEHIDARSFSGSPRVLDGDLHYFSLQNSIAAARVLEAQLQRRLDQTAIHWDINVQALQVLCRPPLSPVAALACKAEPSEPLYLAPEGTSAFNIDASVRRFVLVKSTERAKPYSDSTNYDNPLQLIAHVARDWSQEGSSSRQALYGPPLAQMVDLPPDANVLVPGSGTGRLAWELATMGYRVLANDVSFGMLSATSSILARKLSDGSLKLCPHVHEENSNQATNSRRWRHVEVPDVFPSTQLEHVQRISLQHGDFMTLFRSEAFSSHFDAIVTNFFLDTADNVLEYLEAIRHCLVLGGRWVNHGPLQWHSANALALSLEDLVDVINAMGFHFVTFEPSKGPVPYGLDYEGELLKSDPYEPVLWVAVRTS